MRAEIGSARRGVLSVVTVLGAVFVLPAMAQLSSPMPGVPAGSGAGVHGANSPFAPLNGTGPVAILPPPIFRRPPP